MIDTLRLNLIDCEIKRSCPLTVQQGTIDFSTGLIHNENDLFIDNTGKIVKGSKAYLNDEKFNLTIQPSITTEMNDFNHTKLKIKRFKRINETIQPDLYDWNDEDNEVKGIFISTSLPRLLNETNLKTLSFEDQQKALKFLEGRLREYGIKTNIFNAALSRVDTFTNINTDEKFFSYYNLFSLMECSRMKSVGYSGESFLWKNGNNQLAIYDKVREIAEKNNQWFLNERKKALGIKNKNIMRIENRLLKKRSIKPFLYSTELNTVNDLYNNYDELKYFHKLTIKNKIFKYELNEINSLTLNQIKNNFIKAKNLYGNRWFSIYCKNLGLYSLSKTGSIPDLKNALMEVYSNYDSKVRQKVSRMVKNINQSKFFYNLIFNDEVVFKTNVDLYNELKTKFYKEVA